MLISVHSGSPYNIRIGSENINTYEVNLRENFLFEFPNVLTPVIVNFFVSGNIGSRSVNTPALTTGTGWPSGSRLTLVVPDVTNFSGPGGQNSPFNGLIVGAGGRGGPGWPQNPRPDGVNPSSDQGEPGGPAISLGYNLDIINNGIIGGGGQGSNFITFPGGVRTASGYGGAGINAGTGVSGGTATYRVGQGPASGGNRGGDLGQAAHGVTNPLNAPFIVLNNFQYSILGGGQTFGGEAPSANQSTWGRIAQT